MVEERHHVVSILHERIGWKKDASRLVENGKTPFTRTDACRGRANHLGSLLNFLIYLDSAAIVVQFREEVFVREGSASRFDASFYCRL